MHNVTYFHVTKSEVKTIWRHAKGETPVVKSSGGIVYG